MTRNRQQRGTILVLVLLVIVTLTLSVLAFSRYMRAERRGVNETLRQKQSRHIAESGVEYLRVFLMKDAATLYERNGYYDNEYEFCGHLVTDGTAPMIGANVGQIKSLQEITDPRDIGHFSVLVPAMSDDGMLFGEAYRYGLEDESAKLNLRWIVQTEKEQPGMGRAMLMRLPGVTDEIADAILDWMDEDDEPREYGAEDEYYTTLDPPYRARNGIPDSVDELLLVKGVTPKLWYGIDWNRNGLVDLGEPDESSLDEFEASSGSLNLGLAAYLTIDSRESNIGPDGTTKINVNMDDLEELRTQLEEREFNQEWIDYIIAYRQQQPEQNTQTSGLSALAQLAGNQTQSSEAQGTKINSLLDLVAAPSGTTESASQTPTLPSVPGQTGGTGNTGSALPISPFAHDINEMVDYLPILYDNLSISDTPVVGRININQAPRTVLELFLAQEDELTDAAMLLTSEADAMSQMSALAGLGTETSLSDTNVSEIIEGILAERISDPMQHDTLEMNYPFWPYTRGIITDWELMKKLEPYFTCQGAVFRAMVVGRFDDMKSPTYRLEVWLDATTPNQPAKVIRIRDLTDLGPGFSAEMLGVAGAKTR